MGERAINKAAKRLRERASKRERKPARESERESDRERKRERERERERERNIETEGERRKRETSCMSPKYILNALGKRKTTEQRVCQMYSHTHTPTATCGSHGAIRGAPPPLIPKIAMYILP